mgnify:CR=1 FL=1
MAKVIPNKDSKFWIHPDDFQKVINYAAASYNEFKSEIAGQMIVVPDEEGDFILKFPVIMEQTVSGGLCTLDETALAQHYAKTAMEHGKDVRFCWWHSHHTMAAFWSGTDDATILSMPSKDWTVSLVVNLKREYKLRIQFFEPFLHEENVELNFLTVDVDVDDTILAEVKEQCTKTVVAATTAYTGHAQTYLPLGANEAGNYGDAYAYGSYGYGSAYGSEVHYNTYTHTRVDMRKVPEDILEAVRGKLNSVMTECGDNDNANDALKEWNEKIQPINKLLKKYNVQVSTFLNGTRLEDALISYWDEDFFEHITPETEEIPF